MTTKKSKSITIKLMLYLSAFLTVLGTIVTIAVFVQNIFEQKVLTVEITSAEEITKYERIPGLKVNFCFNEEVVEHLWEIETKFYYSGRESIIGRGEKKSIINDSIEFYFNNADSILEKEFIKNDPGVKITTWDNNFYISFTQWMSKEILIVRFLVSSNVKTSQMPSINAIDNRVIENVIITTLDYSEDVYVSKPMLDYLFEPFPTIIRILYSMICISFTIGLILFIVYISTDYPKLYEYYLWRRNNQKSFKKYVNNITSIDESEKSTFIKDPSFMPEKYWKNFDGERIKKLYTLLNRLYKTVLIHFVSILVAILLICVILDRISI